MKMFLKCAKPKSLKSITHQFYKLDGVNGYFLKDVPNKDGSIPHLFFDGKWREDKYIIRESQQ